jgi:hypothetical protein
VQPSYTDTHLLIKGQQPMKNRFLLVLIILGCFCSTSNAQTPNVINKELKAFTRVIASPKINVILKKGEKESIELSYNNVSADKINIEVSGRTLHIYLDGARKLERRIEDYSDRYRRYRNMYQGASITAYITYRELDGLEIRGEQELTVQDPIEAPEFTLRAYGENDITLASLKTEYFRVNLYGENKLNIKSGKVIEQRYKLYGENDINTTEMKSAYISTSIFGEGDLRVHSAKEVRINAFGEPTIQVAGNGKIYKRLIFGSARIRRR